MEINTIAVIDAGPMGGGITISCLAAGLPVTTIDTDRKTLATLKARVARVFDRAVEKDWMSAQQAQEARALLTTSTDIAAAGQADLVIEAVFEELPSSWRSSTGPCRS